MTVMCGDRTPSHPPDQTSATRSTTSSDDAPVASPMSFATLRVASARVKSLAPPLPSVLPIAATIRVGSTSPASISLASPVTSAGLAIPMRWMLTFTDPPDPRRGSRAAPTGQPGS
jgi:hypothetical protein